MRTVQSQSLHERTAQLSLGKILRDSFLAIYRPLAAWQTRREYREQLRQMPGYLLRDVGLTEEKVREETSKPFWRE